MKKVLFLPIEIKSRELKSKLFLVSEAIKKNFYCFIGDKAGIFRSVKYYSPGIYFYKSINFTDTNHINKIKKLKNRYVVQDEESGFTHSTNKDLQKYITVRSSNINVSLIDKFFNWGKFDYDQWKKRYKKYSYKFFLTGSPRVDLWNPDLVKKIYKVENKYILNKYGKKIVTVVSSNITSKNDLKRYLKTDKIWLKLRNKKEKYNRLRQLRSDLSFHKRFIKMIDQVSKKNTNINFIIRAHPGESLEDWKKIIKKMGPNVILDNNYDIAPWLYSSIFVIHSSSSVALQTVIMKKKLITFRPNGFLYNRNYPNKFGIIAKNSDTINKILNYRLKIFSSVSKNISLIQKRISNYNNSNASRMIIKEINLISLKKKNISLLYLNILSYLYFLKNNLLNFIKIKKIKKTNFSPQPKIPSGISKLEISKFLTSITSNKLQIKKFGPNCFLIFKK